jgi:amidohydrolase
MDRIEKRIAYIIDENSSKITAFAEDIFAHPELGFKETRTSGKVEEIFKSLSLEVQNNLAITGVKARLKKQNEKEINIAVIGELDAVKSPGHPFADPATGAAHCCGHHAQLGVLYGAALALSDPEIAHQLGGNVTFFAVPAEEYGEIEFKDSLRKGGRLRYLGGKAELIAEGAFDDVDIALGYHSAFGESPYDAMIGGGSSNGFISKLVRFKGRESHAAGSPHTGINALNAAVLGLSALNFQRETFREEDTVRVHPIMTKGGDLVNVIPGEAVIELLVRARNIPAILDANAKATRAFEAGAHAIGAKLEITDLPGYLPLLPEYPDSPFLDAAKKLLHEEKIQEVKPNLSATFSTDYGDLSYVKPVFTFNTPGLSGEAHAENVRVENPYKAYILPAKIMALAVYGLLKNGAAAAKEIKKSHRPPFSREDFTAFLDSIIWKGEKSNV